MENNIKITILIITKIKKKIIFIKKISIQIYEIIQKVSIINLHTFYFILVIKYLTIFK